MSLSFTARPLAVVLRVLTIHASPIELRPMWIHSAARTPANPSAQRCPVSFNTYARLGMPKSWDYFKDYRGTLDYAWFDPESYGLHGSAADRSAMFYNPNKPASRIAAHGAVHRVAQSPVLLHPLPQWDRVRLLLEQLDLGTPWNTQPALTREPDYGTAETHHVIWVTPARSHTVLGSDGPDRPGRRGCPRRAPEGQNPLTAEVPDVVAIAVRTAALTDETLIDEELSVSLSGPGSRRLIEAVVRYVRSHLEVLFRPVGEILVPTVASVRAAEGSPVTRGRPRKDAPPRTEHAQKVSAGIQAARQLEDSYRALWGRVDALATELHDGGLSEAGQALRALLDGLTVPPAPRSVSPNLRRGTRQVTQERPGSPPEDLTLTL